MSLLDDPGLQKVWADGRLIYDRATDSRGPAEALALELFGEPRIERGAVDHCDTIGGL